MMRSNRWTSAWPALLAFAFGLGSYAAPQEKAKEPARQERKDSKQERKDEARPAKARVHKHVYGMDLLGDKLASNGDQKILVQGKFTISADISSGRIAGLKVRNAEKGDVPVTKYVKRAEKPGRSDVRLASTANAQNLVPMWIGYGYIDDDDEETVFWFPIDVILDGDSGAIEFNDGN